MNLFFLQDCWTHVNCTKSFLSKLGVCSTKVVRAWLKHSALTLSCFSANCPNRSFIRLLHQVLHLTHTWGNCLCVHAHVVHVTGSLRWKSKTCVFFCLSLYSERAATSPSESAAILAFAVETLSYCSLCKTGKVKDQKNILTSDTYFTHLHTFPCISNLLKRAYHFQIMYVLLSVGLITTPVKCLCTRRRRQVYIVRMNLKTERMCFLSSWQNSGMGNEEADPKALDGWSASCS